MTEKKVLQFPDGFLWGTSISAYQVEGGNKNDWSEWEKCGERVGCLKKENKNCLDYVCGNACDFYNQYERTFDLAKDLNNNAIRLGIEWSRIEPEKGKFNYEVIAHYKKMIQAAKAKNLQVALTLWHWTNPLWLAAEGGWTNKTVIDYYSRYVETVVKEFGDMVNYWFTENEPTIYVLNSYLRGKFPPSQKSLWQAIKVFYNLVAAHKQAYKIIHKHLPQAKVGANLMFNYIEPARKWQPLDHLASFLFSYFWNKKFVNAIVGTLDCVGAHYYFHDKVAWLPPFLRNENKEVNDMNWEIYPEGIYHILKFLRAYNLPILITENGIADADDDQRPQFIIDHLCYIQQAVSEGVKVIGYFHWSLMDNFEWTEGFTQKFGLYEVDRQTLECKARPSAAVYAEICKNNRLEI
jgi:beta-glucosidase